MNEIRDEVPGKFSMSKFPILSGYFYKDLSTNNTVKVREQKAPHILPMPLAAPVRPTTEADDFIA